MKIIQTVGKRDPQALLAFLKTCRETAQKKGCPQLANITLSVRHIDPLAVLESIYEPTEMHFYLENASQGVAVAGADAVLSAEFSGAGRFDEVKAFAANISENTLAIGDLDAPFAGPQFFCGFSFAEEVEEGYPFKPATVFVPRWQVAKRGAGYAVSANLLVEEESNLEEMASRVLAAHSRFSAFDYQEAQGKNAKEPSLLVEVADTTGEKYCQSVRDALQMIQQRHFEKIVLARSVDIALSGNVDPLEWLNELRGKYSGCYAFSFSNATACSFIGATPERLVKTEGDLFTTEALAGSAARGKNAREDARFAGALLQSEKDLREHRHVIQSIVTRLSHIGLRAEATEMPHLLQLPNVQHLKTDISGTLPIEKHILDLAQELHPTPAVGGTPREKALPHIRALEGMDRGLYSGVLGYFNYCGEGDMIVSIRSALVQGNKARLYAGAGIVDGSEPDKEKSETDLKLKAMLHTLIGDVS